MGHTAANGSLPFINDSDANFRAWVQFIGDNLELGGFIKTTDTGQINNTTVTRPLATNTSMGYEIRRMDDALQATAPIFIKVEYGSLSNAADRPSIWLTFGTGSNGTGTITGIFFARSVFGPGNNSPSASALAKISADVNRFTLAILYTSAINTSGQFILGIERLKDADWQNNGMGLHMYHIGGTLGWASPGNIGHIVLPITGSTPSKESDGGAIHPSADTTLDGADVGVYPMNPVCFGKKVYSPTNFMAYRTTEIATDTNIAVDVDGNTINYQTCGQRHGVTTRTANSPAMMFRYD